MALNQIAIIKKCWRQDTYTLFQNASTKKKAIHFILLSYEVYIDRIHRLDIVYVISG